ARARALPSHRRAALPADSRPARVLLVHARTRRAMSTGLAGTVREVVDHAGLDALVPAITAYVSAQRWSGARGAGASGVEFVDAARLFDGDCTVVFAVVSTSIGARRNVRFALPVGLRPIGDPLAERAPTFMIGELTLGDQNLFAYDAAGDPAYIHWLWDAMREQRSVPTSAAELRFSMEEAGLLDNRYPDVRWL